MDTAWSALKIIDSFDSEKLVQVGDKIFSIYCSTRGRGDEEPMPKVFVSMWNDADVENPWKMIKYPANQDETQIPSFRDNFLLPHKEFIYLWNGYIHNDAEYNSDLLYLYQFNTKTNIWTKIKINGFNQKYQDKIEHSDLMAVVADGKIIIFSGSIKRSIVKSVFSLDLNNFTMKIIATYPSSFWPFSKFSTKIPLIAYIHVGVENNRKICFISRWPFISGSKKPRLIYFDLLKKKKWKVKKSFEEFPEEEIIRSTYSFNGLIYILCTTKDPSRTPIYFDQLYIINPVNGKVVKKNIPAAAQKTSIVDCFKINDKIVFFLKWLNLEQFSDGELTAEQHIVIKDVDENYRPLYFVFYLDFE